MKKWKKKICFLRVRAYQQKSGKTVYSGWSKVVKKKMKQNYKRNYSRLNVSDRVL